MNTRPNPDDAAALARKHGAVGVAVLMLTADGRVAYAHHGLTRWLGPTSGWLPGRAEERLEDVFRAIQDGTEMVVVDGDEK